MIMSDEYRANWKFFVSLIDGYKKYFRKPNIEVLPERDDYLSRYPDAWAYYEPDKRTMFIIEEFDNKAVRFHEYGHWLNACTYFVLEIVWEFFWWGLGFRSLVKNKGGKIRK